MPHLTGLSTPYVRKSTLNYGSQIAGNHRASLNQYANNARYVKNVLNTLSAPMRDTAYGAG